MKIVIGAGGSGGHVFPALSVAKRLRAYGHNVIFLTTKGMAFDLIKKENFTTWIIDPPRVKLANPLSALRETWGMLNAFRDARALVKNFMPGVVVGFGGYGAFPVVGAALAAKVPTLIHEQNVIPSRSNQLLSRFVTKIAISFEESRPHLPAKKCVVTGCPCKDDRPKRSKNEILKDLGLAEGVPTIFVIGGSQGSRRINEEFAKAAVILKGTFDFQFIHICGAADHARFKKEYEKLKIKHCLFDFIDDVQSLYMAADLVIARSGASTVCELISFKKPAILIPYPLVRVHQKENAQIVCDHGLGKIIDDSECFAARLKHEIVDFFQNEKKSIRVIKKSEKLDEKPQERITREVIKLTASSR